MVKEKETEINKNTEDVYILGIETSCDDTCASVVRNGNEILDRKSVV